MLNFFFPHYVSVSVTVDFIGLMLVTTATGAMWMYQGYRKSQYPTFPAAGFYLWSERVLNIATVALVVWRRHVLMS